MALLPVNMPVPVPEGGRSTSGLRSREGRPKFVFGLPSWAARSWASQPTEPGGSSRTVGHGHVYGHASDLNSGTLPRVTEKAGTAMSRSPTVDLLPAVLSQPGVQGSRETRSTGLAGLVSWDMAAVADRDLFIQDLLRLVGLGPLPRSVPAVA